MGADTILGELIGWGIISALLVAYFASVLRRHLQEKKRRKSGDGTIY